MIPSLVAGQLRNAIVEYLSTTFALSDDDARAALAEFLDTGDNGIFRGPYLRVRTPFRKAPDSWRNPLSWTPEWFKPYEHQAKAWQRLSSHNQEPQPTLVTTGTGSGKTESFLIPVLDHCLRARANGQRGVKALLLYPMNALATDQAGRLAKLINGEAALNGVTAGIYIGENGPSTSMGPDHLIDDRHAMRADPPDILLTNYKMLDFLLLRNDDQELWVGARDGVLRYVVLDEFHTYDGAQGTDVAMLLRRLGSSLGLSTADRPLGDVCPVGTSATLGSGPTATDSLREFAGRVFGTPFEQDSIIGESRQTPDEACGTIDFGLPIPEVEDVLELEANDYDGLAALFLDVNEPLNAVTLGTGLLHHPLTWAVLSATGDRARTWDAAVDVIVTRAPNWGKVAQRNRKAVHEALARYLALMSQGRRGNPTDLDHTQPLFAVEVQMWVREVSRLLRAISDDPRFMWLDAAQLESQGAQIHVLTAPAVYCRHCGRAGWMALAMDHDGRLRFNPPHIYEASLKHSGQVRALIKASETEPGVVHIDTETGDISATPTDRTIPVLITQDEKDSKNERCPSCAHDDGIRFLGSQVASLASVVISQLFGSDLVHAEERKLLAFTDSVQDAAHRSAFFAGRTHRFNFRALIAGAVESNDPIPLQDIAEDLLTDAGSSAADVYALVPPDLLRHPKVKTVWTDEPALEGRAILRQRLAFEASLEFGLRNRFGRTLELTGSLAANVLIDDFDATCALVDEVINDVGGQESLIDASRTDAYLQGLLDRLRLRGGIFHPWLDNYAKETNASRQRYRIWGGREDGMPAFPWGQSAPIFYTTAPKSDSFDSLTSAPASGTWLTDWTSRSLGIDAKRAATVNQRVMAMLGHEGIVDSRMTDGGATIYGLSPSRVLVHDLPETHSDDAPHQLRCTICAGRHVVPVEVAERWLSSPCLRFRCPGSYEFAPEEPSNYYRELYRSGTVRRVVTAEHTGLLTRVQRESVESKFKNGTAADAPNVITATPTMELGIDIGDLSAVMLTSVPRQPASYIQRVGRAGRLTGNAFVATFVPTEPRSLYYLEQPEFMITGEVQPPNCYLDAVEILHRQYFAFLLDRAAAGLIQTIPMPRDIGTVVKSGMENDGWLFPVVNASRISPSHVDDFCALFGAEISDASRASLQEFATSGLENGVSRAFHAWDTEQRELRRRRDRLKESIEKLETKPFLDDNDEQELKRLNGERGAVIGMMREDRGKYTLSALEGMGLLPNYMLHDEATLLKASLWSRDDSGKYDRTTYEYSRPADLALTEFAPGNSFYAQGHRLIIDGLELGSSNEPLTEIWRVCPECGYGAREDSKGTWASCPRCELDAIADAGARHVLLWHRQVTSMDSEEATRIYDETDDRDRERYEMATTVDVDPAHVKEAWQHTGQTFGVELASVATVRSINLGPARRSGVPVSVGGHEYSASRFRTCLHCGVVDGARPRRSGSTGPEHRGWCVVRSGRRTEAWEEPSLLHELRTEAVRILLPVSTFEVDERLASFKGALLLGLRLDFGGDPEHLRILKSDYPGSSGPGRRNFLVLCDTVPGGTGYLGRIADPSRLKVILERAREAIARCQCREEGRVACHRCLLGGVAPSEIDLVSRNLALELLEQLLENWDFIAVPTVTGINIESVKESELERRFKFALRRWASKPESKAKIVSKPSQGLWENLELSISDGDTLRRWMIIEQHDMKQTVPDYLIRRVDGPDLQIAVYLDGFGYHATHEHNRVADDARKREDLRRQGRLVWNLSWQDVEDFHKAADSGVAKDPPDRPLLHGRGRKTVGDALLGMNVRGIDAAVVDHNPVRQLLDFLRTPDVELWQQLSLALVAGAAAQDQDSSQYQRDNITDALREAAVTGRHLEPSPGGNVFAMRCKTDSEFVINGFLDLRDDVGGPGAMRWTVFSLLDDSLAAMAAVGFQARWRDWLQWANMLQFVRGSGREVVIDVRSRMSLFDYDDLSIVPPLLGERPRTESGAAELAPAVEEELELIMDEATRALVEEVLRRGGDSEMRAGYEPESGDAGWQLEAAWPHLRVAVLDAPDDERDRWLAEDGWKARVASEWSCEELLAVLKRVL